MRTRVVAITGIPGAGKSDLAQAVADHFKIELISSHDLVAAVDPDALTEGRMADMDTMARVFSGVMHHMSSEELVIDGWPRTRDQMLLLPADHEIILLTCRVDVARDRLMRRKRADDTPALIDRRLTEQAAAFVPWAFEAAEWERTINTTQVTAAWIAERVIAYLDGTRRDCH